MNTVIGLILIVLSLYLLVTKLLSASTALERLTYKQLVNNQQSLVAMIIASLQNKRGEREQAVTKTAQLRKIIDSDYEQVLRIIEPMRGHSAYNAERSLYIAYAQSYRQLQVACQRLLKFLHSPTDNNKEALVDWMEHDYVSIENKLANESE